MLTLFKVNIYMRIQVVLDESFYACVTGHAYNDPNDKNIVCTR